MRVLEREISRVAIVDDQAESRKSYGYTVENADLLAVPADDPLGDVVSNARLNTLQSKSDAALCDFNLSGRAYASFNGAELVSHWYRENFPAILCTKWEKVQIEHIRPLRRWIPVLMQPSDLNEESLVAGLEDCIYELQGNFKPERRPWRAQVHFLEADKEFSGYYFAEVPGWDRSEVFRIKTSDISSNAEHIILPDFRCHARVNLGAEDLESLYICDWEL